MKENKTVSMKAVALLLVVVLLVGCTIGGTLAWLMTSTPTVTNTFTAGKVEIALKEHTLDGEGKQIDPDQYTDTGLDQIMLVPGRRIEKDPAVTVLEGSEDCYVRVLLKVTWPASADPVFAKQVYQDWFEFSNGWSFKQLFDGSFDKHGQYVGVDIWELRYNGTVTAMEGDVKLPVFTAITVPEDLTADEVGALNGCTVELIAQAIQSKGFADADTAWDEADMPMTMPVVPELPDEEENP